MVQGQHRIDKQSNRLKIQWRTNQPCQRRWTRGCACPGRAEQGRACEALRRGTPGTPHAGDRVRACTGGAGTRMDRMAAHIRCERAGPAGREACSMVPNRRQGSRAASGGTPAHTMAARTGRACSAPSGLGRVEGRRGRPQGAC